MKNPATSNRLALDLETALSGLVKLTKALKFYPAEHPTLIAAAEETCQSFQPLLAQHDTRPYHVTKDGFSLDALPLAPGNQNLKELAQKLVERRVRHLLFLPELANHELLIFAEQIALPAEQLFKQGGLPQQLSDRGIKSIWINEPDLEKVLGNLNQWGGEPDSQLTGNGAPGPLLYGEQGAETEKNRPNNLNTAPSTPPPRQSTSTLEQMRDLLEHLKEPLDDDRYLQTLNQVVQLAPAFFDHTGIAGLLAVLNLLEAQRQDLSRNSVQIDAAAAAFGQLLSNKVIQQLVNAVAEPSLKASQLRALARLLVGLKMKAAPTLFKRLNSERDAILRRRYSSILAHLGTAVFDLLETALNDPHWYVVRNAVTVLGETRKPEALPLLEKALQHPEVRVRRAIIRALGAIGGSDAIPPLAQLSQDPQPELHQPAIMALGALGDPEVLVPLNDILKKSDLWGKKTLLKLEVIKAMAATKSPQAIIPLLKLARRPNLIQRKNLERLRAEAILSLGQLGNKKLLPVLDRLPKSDKGPVSRALKQATTQLSKAD
ncbi:MAG TPA: HEAT repeat domain-containing protein [Malonomonas sp.]